MIHSSSVHDPFVFLSISVQSLCAFSICFESVLYSFRVPCSRSTCTWQFHFYSLQKSAHQVSCLRAVGRKIAIVLPLRYPYHSDTLTTPIPLPLRYPYHSDTLTTPIPLPLRYPYHSDTLTTPIPLPLRYPYHSDTLTTPIPLPLRYPYHSDTLTTPIPLPLRYPYHSDTLTTPIPLPLRYPYHSDTLTTPILIVLPLTSHASLNHTLCLHAFLLLFFRLCRSTVLQGMALALQLTTYVCTYRLHVQVDRR